jgi:hypothetical protein
MSCEERDLGIERPAAFAEAMAGQGTSEVRASEPQRLFKIDQAVEIVETVKTISSFSCFGTFVLS